MGIEDQRHETGCAMPIPSSSSSLVACQPASLSLSLFFFLSALASTISCLFDRFASSHSFTTLRTTRFLGRCVEQRNAFCTFSPAPGRNTTRGRQAISVGSSDQDQEGRCREHIILIQTVFCVNPGDEEEELMAAEVVDARSSW